MSFLFVHNSNYAQLKTIGSIDLYYEPNGL